LRIARSNVASGQEGVYTFLTVKKSLAGAGWMTAGVLVTILAAKKVESP
jgi:hypothetical protein